MRCFVGEFPHWLRGLGGQDEAVGLGRTVPTEF